jgi:type III secretory pathway lipoprotein EscJ
MRGVLEARVHLNLPENDPLFGTRKESSGSGSVLLVTDSDFSAKDEEVAALVSGAAGIPAAKVSVLRSRAERQISDPLQVKAESAQPATDLKPQGDAAPVVSTEFSAVNRSAAMLSGVVIIAVAGMTCLAARVLQSRRRKVLFPLPSGVIAED